MSTRYDPDLKYCPQCGEEYQKHASRCVDCSVLLLSGTRMVKRQRLKEQHEMGRMQPIEKGEPLLPVQHGNILHIKQLQAELRRVHLVSMVSNNEEQTCGKSCCQPEVTLYVREADYADVTAFLQRQHAVATGLADHDTRYIESVFDQDMAEVICPACGHAFEPTSTTCPDCGLCLA
ncbi:zinc ribbon-containing (seleno)protein DG [Desulfogranum japonicum]|uniref:zinc ribbon-containing (seleno)protein DG n=1 Tax=Desulfogranum japonicum TaxID=231447 RepID=UPI00042A5188|nr:hypothetical protein [Desulfogranum japonicum]